MTHLCSYAKQGGLTDRVRVPSVHSQGKLLTIGDTSDCFVGIPNRSRHSNTFQAGTLFDLLDEIRFPTEVDRAVAAVKAFLISSACPQHSRDNNIFFAHPPTRGLDIMVSEHHDVAGSMCQKHILRLSQLNLGSPKKDSFMVTMSVGFPLHWALGLIP